MLQTPHNKGFELQQEHDVQDAGERRKIENNIDSATAKEPADVAEEDVAGAVEPDETISGSTKPENDPDREAAEIVSKMVLGDTSLKIGSGSGATSKPKPAPSKPTPPAGKPKAKKTPVDGRQAGQNGRRINGSGHTNTREYGQLAFDKIISLKPGTRVDAEELASHVRSRGMDPHPADVQKILDLAFSNKKLRTVVEGTGAKSKTFLVRI